MKRLNRVGEKLTTNQGYEIEIINYINSKEITVQFNDLHKTVVSGVRYGDIKGLRNPNHLSHFNIGFLGQGYYNMKEHPKAYIKWRGMLERCYCKKYHSKKPTYIGCSVADDWHNFQNFAQWFYENNTESFELDKDILLKENKIYSPKTCCFVPSEVNVLFTKNIRRGKYPVGVSLHREGKFQASMSVNNKQIYLGLYNTPEEAFQVYKTAKEKYIKEVADKWKDQIIDKVYEAMYNYQVEITD
jgi:hypothetical protein